MFGQITVGVLIIAVMAAWLIDRYRGPMAQAQYRADLECAFGAGCPLPGGWSHWTVADNTSRCPGSLLSLSRCQMDPAASAFERRRFDLGTVDAGQRARDRSLLQQLGGVALDANHLIFERRKDQHRAANQTTRRPFLGLIRGE